MMWFPWHPGSFHVVQSVELLGRGVVQYKLGIRERELLCVIEVWVEKMIRRGSDWLLDTCQNILVDRVGERWIGS